MSSVGWPTRSSGMRDVTRARRERGTGPHTGPAHPGPLSRRYYDTKIAEGKTRNEAMRCLKRRLADQALLCAPWDSNPEPAD